MNARENELKELTNTFENVFILGTLNKYAQKNPAEKFIRFTENLLKKSRLTVDKIRLRTSSLNVHYLKTCAQLSTKEEIGKNLQEVDFEQLQIENKHLIDKIDKRNLLLMELKRMNGRANLLLSQNKKHLLKKLENKQAIADKIEEYKNKTLIIDEDSDVAKLKLDKTKDEYDVVKQKTESYEVPSVLEYVRMKAELDNLKKTSKATERRYQLKSLALRSSIREIQHITRSSTARLSWFEEPISAQNFVEKFFEFRFAVKKKSQKSARQQRVSAWRMSYKP